MKYKRLRLIGVLCIFAFSNTADARETLIQLPDGALDKIITDFKGTRVYNNGNLIYSSDGDSHEQTMNTILKSGGSLVSDNKSFSFSISSRVPAIGSIGTSSATTTGSTASKLSGASSSALTSGSMSTTRATPSASSLFAPSSMPASDLASPSSTTPDSDLVPDFTPDDDE